MKAVRMSLFRERTGPLHLLLLKDRVLFKKDRPVFQKNFQRRDLKIVLSLSQRDTSSFAKMNFQNPAKGVDRIRFYA